MRKYNYFLVKNNFYAYIITLFIGFFFLFFIAHNIKKRKKSQFLHTVIEYEFKPRMTLFL